MKALEKWKSHVKGGSLYLTPRALWSLPVRVQTWERAQGGHDSSSCFQTVTQLSPFYRKDN